MIGEILSAFFAAAAWTGTLALLWLFHRQGQAFPIFYRFFRWLFLAWSAAIIIQITNYVSWENDGWSTQWLPQAPLSLVRIVVFRAIMTFATWRLLQRLLMPQTRRAAAIPEAQIQMDTQGNVVGWNEAATALFGWTAEEMLGTELAARLIPPAMQEHHRAGLAHYRETGEAPLLDARYTQIALCKNGKNLLIDVSLTAHLTPKGTIFLGTCAPARLL
jgi:PAS domain S-box-containing protein